MRMSYFYGRVMEEEWSKLRFIDFEGFRLGKEYKGRINPLYSDMDALYRYERIAEEKIFFYDVLSVEFEIGWKVKVNNEVVKILDVVHRTDGSIEYHTDKVLRVDKKGFNLSI